MWTVISLSNCEISFVWFELKTCTVESVFTMHCIAVSEQLVYESSGVPVIFLTVASARFLSGDVQIGGNWHKSRKNQAHAYHARWGTRNRTDVVVHRSLVRLCREEIRRAPWFVSSRISYGQGAHSRRRMGCHGSPMGGKIQCNTIRYDSFYCSPRSMLILFRVFILLFFVPNKYNTPFSMFIPNPTSMSRRKITLCC